MTVIIHSMFRSVHGTKDMLKNCKTAKLQVYNSIALTCNKQGALAHQYDNSYSIRWPGVYYHMVSTLVCVCVYCTIYVRHQKSWARCPC